MAESRSLKICAITSRAACSRSCEDARHDVRDSLTAMFPSSSSFPSSSTTGTGQEQRSQFPHSHSHSHSVQYNGSPFNVAGMTNQTAASPSIRGGSLGMSMGTSLGMGSPLGESLSQSRSHYQSGYLMVRPSSGSFDHYCLTCYHHAQSVNQSSVRYPYCYHHVFEAHAEVVVVASRRPSRGPSYGAYKSKIEPHILRRFCFRLWDGLNV